MRKILTVLLLNFLHSARRSRRVLFGITGVFALVLLALGTVFYTHASSSARLQQASIAGSQNSLEPKSANAGQGGMPSGKLAPRPNSSTKQGTDTRPGPNTIPSLLQSSGGTPNNGNTGSTSGLAFEIKTVSLADAALVCRDHQSAYAVSNAKVSFTTAYHGSGALRWYWEARVDGAEATDNPPISNQTYTDNVAAGSQAATLQKNQSEPLLIAPTSSMYSYSFRLHITSPADVVSDWVAVPLVLDGSCSS